MIERTIDHDIEELNDLILKMGNMVEESIVKSIEALKNRDDKLAQSIIEDDEKMDNFELEVDDKAITLLATKQPMAKDLRFITTAMSIATDLERMGDLAVDIAQKTLELNTMPLLKPLIDTPKLAEVAKNMIRLSLDSFIKRAPELEKQIYLMEKEADDLRNLISTELIEIMAKDSQAVTRAIPLLLIARFLERICDHAMNIAEDVVYMVEGKVIKHHHNLA